MKQFQFHLIKTFREEKNMTQVELARIMGEGATKSQICSFERGRGKGLTVRTLARLADALGRSPDDFFRDGESTTCKPSAPTERRSHEDLDS